MVGFKALAVLLLSSLTIHASPFPVDDTSIEAIANTPNATIDNVPIATINDNPPLATNDIAITDNNPISTMNDKYADYKVYRFTPSTPSELQFIQDTLETYETSLGIDEWSHGHTNTIDIMIPSSSLPSLTSLLALPHTLRIPDLKLHLDLAAKTSTPASSDFFGDYRDLNTTMEFLEGLEGVQKVSIGKSAEGSDIPGVKIGNGTRTVVMHGGIHAREWISPAVVTYIAHHLTTSPFRFLYTFHIIPILNVDGYNYSRTVDRFWRKNRQRNEGSSCVGTDINRNFGYNWGTAGASSEPCSQTYHGPSSFSSPESKALSTYIQSLPNVVSYIDFHSYSQLWLFPNTLSCNTPIPDFDLLSRAATLITTSLKSLYGTTYVSGDACNTIYPASGNTIDWTYGVANVTFSFAVELRDDGTYGFELPKSMIKATGEETVEGLKALWGFMEGYYNGSIKAEGVEKGKKSSASKGLGWGGVWVALLLALWW